MEVCINKKDWDKIINYARCASEEWGTEIGGMAVTVQQENGDWQIMDPVIMKQDVSAALCVLDKTELAKYYSKMAIKYKKKEIRFCWWHSHAKMDAFWSGTDTNTIDEYEDGDLSFALVVNVKEEYKCRVSVWKPWVMHEDVELNFLDKEDGYNIPASITKEVKSKCTQPKSTWYNSGSHYNPKQTNISFIKNSSKLATAKDHLITQAWIELIDKVDEINGQFISGEYEYDRYKKKLDDINRRLQNAKMPLHVNIISQGSFEDILHVSASDIIECDSGYEHLNPYDNIEDVMSYNKSFGIGGYYG
tara:strand:- start:241 stop:1155 length:915 start_codon:yes stop_codon:yes gene_type:complete